MSDPISVPAGMGRAWDEVLPEATRRLLGDALLRTRARAAAGLIRNDQGGAFARGWSSREQHLAEWAAAVVLVIAERPELLTGERPSGAPPVEVIAGYLASFIPTDYPTSAVREAAGAVLTVLELQGYEVTRRADRFPHLEHTEKRVRIPLRGVCGACRVTVERRFDGQAHELLVGPWRHVGPNTDSIDGHEPDAVEWL